MHYLSVKTLEEREIKMRYLCVKKLDGQAIKFCHLGVKNWLLSGCETFRRVCN